MEEICLDHFGTKVFEVKAMQTPLFLFVNSEKSQVGQCQPWILPMDKTSRLDVQIWNCVGAAKIGPLNKHYCIEPTGKPR